MNVLVIPSMVKHKLSAYEEAGGSKEVSGLAKVSSDGELRIEDVNILPLSKSSGGFTETDNDKLAEFFSEKLEESSEEADSWGHCYWHTHPNMGAFESGEDKDTAKKWLESSPFYIQLILGKEWKAWLWLKDPYCHITLEIEIEEEVPEGYDDWIKEAKEMLPDSDDTEFIVKFPKITSAFTPYNQTITDEQIEEAWTGKEILHVTSMDSYFCHCTVLNVGGNKCLSAGNRIVIEFDLDSVEGKDKDGFIKAAKYLQTSGNRYSSSGGWGNRQLGYIGSGQAWT